MSSLLSCRPNGPPALRMLSAAEVMQRLLNRKSDQDLKAEAAEKKIAQRKKPSARKPRAARPTMVTAMPRPKVERPVSTKRADRFAMFAKQREERAAADAEARSARLAALAESRAIRVWDKDLQRALRVIRMAIARAEKRLTLIAGRVPRAAAKAKRTPSILVNQGGLQGRVRVLAQTTPKGSVLISVALSNELAGLRNRGRARVQIQGDHVVITNAGSVKAKLRPGVTNEYRSVTAYKKNVRLTVGTATFLDLPQLRLSQSAVLPIEMNEEGFKFSLSALRNLFNQEPKATGYKVVGTMLIAERPIAIARVRSFDLDGVDVIEIYQKIPGVAAKFSRKHDLQAYLQS
jgi:hypothetical protein